MKKVIVFSFMLLALTSFKALAQTDEQATRPVKTGDEWQMPKDVLLRAKAFSEGLQKSLGLDEAATKKVFNVYMGNTKSVDEIRMGHASEKEKKEALAANQAEFDQKLKGILSPAQFDIYLKNKPRAKN
ncbi:hypothetical protein ACFFGT_04400 [Mucilaginibacter angelicae]|uniref:DUF4890 domain-containing protein n=1 Tax=Mucilaginibacter angelicae TaxID=869718 RepID=A0ABV6L125_9SPHI